MSIIITGIAGLFAELLVWRIQDLLKWQIGEGWNMTEYFSTHLLDRVIAKKREEREQARRDRLSACFRALDKLSCLISFEEAYIFGSLAKPYQFFGDSDVDVAFLGLSNKDFFPAIAFLSRELNTDVDVVQLEDHPLNELIIREGIQWKKKG